VSDIPIGRAATDTRAQVFVAGVLAVSILPAAIVAAPLTSVAPAPGLVMLGNLTWLLGTAHVALTGFLWFDRRYRGHINAQPGYFYGLPAVLAAFCVAAALLAGRAGELAFMALFQMWLLHHFGRQNWGVLCLTAAGLRTGPASEIERQICRWAPVAGMAGLPAALPILADFEWAAGLRSVSLAASLGIAAAALWLAARQIATGTPIMRAAVTVLVGVFFLPIPLIGIGGIGVTGTAHAAQYALIIGYMAASRQGSDIRPWALPLAVLALAYIGIYLAMMAQLEGAAPPIVTAVTVLWAGVTLWHFIVDANVWKLRDAFQRKTLRDSLPFLFRRA